MPNAYLASELVEAIREEGMLPSADDNASAAKLIATMNREQRLYLMELLQSAKEEYRTSTQDIALVAGTLAYDLPAGAVAATVASVRLVDSAGAETPLEPVPRGAAGRAVGDYYFQRNQLVLTAALSGTLRVVYPRRFNRIVTAEEAGEVLTIATVGGVSQVDIVGSALPVLWSSGDPFDIIKGAPHFDVLYTDKTATFSATTLTFAEELVGVEAGDFVARAGETPIANMAIEVQDVLVLRAVMVHLHARGDPKWQTAATLLKEARDNLLSLITPRASETPELLINYSAPGWNRGFWRRRLGV